MDGRHPQSPSPARSAARRSGCASPEARGATASRWGALLNTRGLVELIVLNIVYKAGVFSPELFSMMVVMALVTTMMATPLLNALHITGEEESSPQRQAVRAA